MDWIAQIVVIDLRHYRLAAINSIVVDLLVMTFDYTVWVPCIPDVTFARDLFIHVAFEMAMCVGA